MTITIEKPALSAKAAKFLTKELKLFIDGKWVAAKSGKTFPVEDPATKETIANASAGEKADIDLAVSAARRAFEAEPWSRISADRSRLVWRLGDLLEQHIDEFANSRPSTMASL